MAYLYIDCYVIIGVSKGQRFFKLRLIDAKVPLTKRVGVDDVLDTIDFNKYEELSINQLSTHLAIFQCK